MSFLRTLRKLILGETWTLPLGVAAVVLVVALVVRPAMDDAWHAAGGFVLLAGIALVLVVSVARSSGARRRQAPP
ncbi:MAG TPA: hypothetical protein VK501_27995 [Baekduia sp.]|uniref:hypothetical protein n=1 Tax=Baekduia sp. TaxID=2600305 RepID=UPI002CECD13B|nr:hypothetical protein [Baekduia sp.]HMJ37782.1 hypothetical protein [Baekduia sp.]